MSATFSLYLRAELLRRYFLLDDAPVYLALTRATPPANATGAQLAEPGTGGYARAPYRLGTDFWAETGFGDVYNTRAIAFPTPTADWGLVVGWALCTAPSSGMTLTVGRMTTPRPAPAGIPVSVPVQACTLGLS